MANSALPNAWAIVKNASLLASRKEFEAWLRRECPEAQGLDPLQRTNDDAYLFGITQWAWRAWQYKS